MRGVWWLFIEKILVFLFCCYFKGPNGKKKCQKRAKMPNDRILVGLCCVKHGPRGCSGLPAPMPAPFIFLSSSPALSIRDTCGSAPGRLLHAPTFLHAASSSSPGQPPPPFASPPPLPFLFLPPRQPLPFFLCACAAPPSSFSSTSAHLLPPRAAAACLSSRLRPSPCLAHPTLFVLGQLTVSG